MRRLAFVNRQLRREMEWVCVERIRLIDDLLEQRLTKSMKSKLEFEAKKMARDWARTLREEQWRRAVVVSRCTRQYMTCMVPHGLGSKIEHVSGVSSAESLLSISDHNYCIETDGCSERPDGRDPMEIVRSTPTSLHLLGEFVPLELLRSRLQYAARRQVQFNHDYDNTVHKCSLAHASFLSKYWRFSCISITLQAAQLIAL